MRAMGRAGGEPDNILMHPFVAWPVLWRRRARIQRQAAVWPPKRSMHMYNTLAVTLMGLWTLGMVLMALLVHEVLTKDSAPSTLAAKGTHLTWPSQ
jgi:hypothetical protein